MAETKPKPAEVPQEKPEEANKPPKQSGGFGGFSTPKQPAKE